MTKQTKIFDKEYNQPWIVRLVTKGGKYGRQWCLTHDKDEPLVEFYMTQKSGRRVTSKTSGFISRYYLETLQERDKDKWSSAPTQRPSRGLCLHGGGIYEKSINIGGGALEKALSKLTKLTA
jgi:hypothetical protein